MHRLAALAVSLATLAIAPACSAQSAGVTSSPATPSGTLFVANKRGNSLSRIDLATGEETHRVDTCENPHELAVTPDEERVMVACYSGSSMQLFATSDLAPLDEIELAPNARVHSALWLDDTRAIAGAEGRGTLFVIDAPAEGEAATQEVGTPAPEAQQAGRTRNGAHLLALSADNSTAWGTINPAGEVVRYDLTAPAEESRRKIGEMTESLALSPDGSALWVGSNSDSVIYRLDPDTLAEEARIPVGATPIRMAMHPSGRWIATSNMGEGTVSVIDTQANTVARTIPVSASNAGQVTLVFSPDGSRLYAAETMNDVIAEVDFESGEVLRRIPAGAGGDGLAVLD